MAADEGLAHEERREAGDLAHDEVTPAKTSDLAAGTRPRFGTAIRLVRIIPDEYSELMQGARARRWPARRWPPWLTPVGSQLSFWETLNLA